MTPVLDVRPGIMVTVLPAFAPPVFLRLVPAAGGVVDRARRAWVAAADGALATCRAAWRDGAGVLVGAPPADAAALAAEVHQVGRTLEALGDPGVAAAYLDFMGIPAGDGAGGGPTITQPTEGD